MNNKLFLCGKIITGENKSYFRGSIATENDEILFIAEDGDEATNEFIQNFRPKIIDLSHLTIIPGFIDIHTHGALGLDFVNPTQRTVDRIARQFAKEGVTGFLSSIMVLPRKEEIRVLKKYATLTSPHQGSRWLGIHNEGPYMSHEYKAMMDDRYLRLPDIDELNENVRVAEGKLRMITLAPELKGMEEFIPACKEKGITVMMGHSSATAPEVLHAITLGADGFTHLYNAMTQHTHRNPGMVSAALLKGETFAELICDGVHVDPLVIRLTYQTIGSERIVLITDAMPGKAMADGEFIFGGIPCITKNGKAYARDTGRIAGSVIGMDDAFRNIQKFTGCSMEDAVRMCSVNPSKLIHLDQSIGSLHPHKKADFIALDCEMKVMSVIIGAERIL